MNREAAAQFVAPFYSALNNPAQKDVAALVESVASPEWRSYAGEGVSKGRDEFIKQVMGFGKMIPDLKWDIKEVLADAVDPVPMKAIRVGAIDSGCGPKKCRSFSFAFDGRKLVWENRSLAPRLRPSRSPISSAVETSPPPL